MDISKPFTTQELTSDINCNTYSIHTQTTSDQFDLDAQLQRAVQSIQPTEYEAHIFDMEVAYESHPFTEPNVTPIVESISSAINPWFGSLQLWSNPHKYGQNPSWEHKWKCSEGKSDIKHWWKELWHQLSILLRDKYTLLLKKLDLIGQIT